MAGRPRTFDREQALETAVEHFWRYGYEDTTVAGLTEAMGITPPSLYAAFGDKERLFSEAADCYSARIAAALQHALDRPHTLEALAQLLQATAAAHTDAATPPGCFVLTEPRLREHRAELRRRIAARIRRGLDEGEVPSGTDPERLAAFIVAIMGGMSARARDGGSAADVEGIARLALAAIQWSTTERSPRTAGRDRAAG